MTILFYYRSPKDKYIVYRESEPSSSNVWWGKVNQKMSEEVFEELKQMCLLHFQHLEKIFVFDGACGAEQSSKRTCRFICEFAWQCHFVSNMFIDVKERLLFPDFTVINACSVKNSRYQLHGLHSENFIAIDIENRLMLIGGTSYAGEMKKGMFSMMNYWLPLQGILTIHCSANIGQDSHPSDAPDVPVPVSDAPDVPVSSSSSSGSSSSGSSSSSSGGVIASYHKNHHGSTDTVFLFLGLSGTGKVISHYT